MLSMELLSSVKVTVAIFCIKSQNITTLCMIPAYVLGSSSGDRILVWTWNVSIKTATMNFVWHYTSSRLKEKIGMTLIITSYFGFV